MDPMTPAAISETSVYLDTSVLIHMEHASDRGMDPSTPA